MTQEYELTLHDYIDILRRRVSLMLAVFVTVIVLTIITAVVLPPVYQSSGTILIESQQISAELISTSVTGSAAERIEVIKHRVMTRENLFQLINKYNLFKEKSKNRVTSELIDDLRDAIEITLLSSNQGGRRRGQTTIAFTVAFEYHNPNKAFKVTNELVTLFLDENIKSRVERATETTKFLRQEARRLKSDLEKMESLVAAYKQEHADALPEHLSLRVQSLQRSELALAELDRDYKSIEAELRRLDIEQAGSGSDGLSLESLNAEYQQAIILYKERHPTVRLLKRKIEALTKAEKTGTNLDLQSSNQTNTMLSSKIKSSIKVAKIKLESLEQQRKPLRKKIERLEKQIIKTPQVELGISSLTRDHNSARKKYEEIQAKQLSAQISENLEGENKSERFTLIDPPLLADKPIKPNRIKIILIGIFLAFGAAVGFAILFEMLNQRLRGAGAITAIMGEAPLVSIPYITTSDEYLEKKKLIIKVTISVVASVILLSILFHFLYMPLDLLLYKILARLG